MTQKDLFKLADVLSSNQCICTWLEVEEETTFKKAFEPTLQGILDSMKIDGKYVVIYCESEVDYCYIWKEIFTKIPNIAFTSWAVSYQNQEDDYRIIIDCNENQK